MSFYEMGYEAYYEGTSCPANLTEEQKREWGRGWRAADRREEYRLGNG